LGGSTGLGGAAGLGAGAAGLLGAGAGGFFCAGAEAGMAIRLRESNPKTTPFLRGLQFIVTLLARSRFISTTNNFAGTNPRKAGLREEYRAGQLNLCKKSLSIETARKWPFLYFTMAGLSKK
jgi:hypothetical protein